MIESILYGIANISHKKLIRAMDILENGELAVLIREKKKGLKERIEEKIFYNEIKLGEETTHEFTTQYRSHSDTIPSHDVHRGYTKAMEFNFVIEIMYDYIARVISNLHEYDLERTVTYIDGYTIVSINLRRRYVR